MTAQAGHLNSIAVARGYASADEWITKDPSGFVVAAAEWRENNPRYDFSLPSPEQQRRDIRDRARSQKTVDLKSAQDQDIARAIADIREFERDPSYVGPMMFGSVPHALRMVGARAQPMQAHASIVEKAFVGKHKQEFVRVDVKDVVEGLYRPAAIMQSPDGGYEIVTPTRDAFRNPVFWAVQPTTDRDAAAIKTVFGIKSYALADRFQNEEAPRKLLYVDYARLNGLLRKDAMDAFKKLSAQSTGVLGPKALERWIATNYEGPAMEKDRRGSVTPHSPLLKIDFTCSGRKATYTSETGPPRWMLSSTLRMITPSCTPLSKASRIFQSCLDQLFPPASMISGFRRFMYSGMTLAPSAEPA
jgi:hypothetical protein